MKIWLRENIPFYGIRGSNQPFISAPDSATATWSPGMLMLNRSYKSQEKKHVHEDK